MDQISRYHSPLGPIFLAADQEGLTGLWFEGQAHYAKTLSSSREESETSILTQTKCWLDIYFSGQNPSFLPPLHLRGTPFQQAVWTQLLTIPYGQTRSYGQIAAALNCKSAQAVGGAVGRNPISILVPCHRVLGAGGDLTSYAGGISRKTALLELERT